ncbi:MAG: HD domain-containing protein [Mycoplasmataceae bacterium]|nr:HD domain-containing protein [Mycoplasmataceae bacterium]
MTNRDYKFRVLYQDSVHGRIKISNKIISDLIHTREFQRLREIKQLAGTSYLYPSAEHSRFVHSLGTYEIARRILNKLDSKVSEEDRILVLCAALLHDLGHGPFSHIFEIAFTNIRHEKFTKKIILNPDSDINKVLTMYSKDFPKKIALLIDGKYSKNWMNKIISSEIDVDRIDYLLRDDKLSNAGYSSFNLEWLIKAFNIYNDELVFDSDSISTIETFLIGRYHMFKNVYNHPKDLAFSVLLNQIINRIEWLYKKNYKFKSNMEQYKLLKNADTISHYDFLKLNDSYVRNFIYELNNEDDQILSNLSKSLMQGRLLKVFNLDNKDEEKIFIQSTKGMIENQEYSVVKLNDSFYKSSLSKLEDILIYNSGKINKITNESIFLSERTADKKNSVKKYGYLLVV